MTPAIVGLILDARGTSRAPDPSRPSMRRVVCRIDLGTIARIDALRPSFPESSRAALVRAFCVLGVGLAEEHVKAMAPAAPPELPAAPAEPEEPEGGAS